MNTIFHLRLVHPWQLFENQLSVTSTYCSTSHCPHWLIGQAIYIGMDVLLKLPESLTSKIITDWLCVKDALRIDSAHCSRALRSKYISVAYSTESIYKHFSSRSSRFGLMVRQFKWIVARNAVVNRLHITAGPTHDFDVQQLCLQVMQRAGSALEHVEIDFMCIWTKFRVELLEALTSCCCHVTHVKLSFCGLSGHMGPMLHACANIQRLEVRAIPDSFAPWNGDRCSCLRELQITSASIMNTEFSIFMAACPMLTSLELAECKYLTDEGLHAIADHCLRLQRLLIMGSDMQLSAAVATQIFMHCPALTTVWIDQTPNDTAVLALAEHCPQLVNLSMEHCSGITDVSIAELARMCTKLENLYLAGSSITDISLRTLGEHCHRLVNVNCSYCAHVTGSGVLAVYRNCPQLRQIAVDYVDTSGITAAIVQELSDVLVSKFIYSEF